MGWPAASGKGSPAAVWKPQFEKKSWGAGAGSWGGKGKGKGKGRAKGLKGDPALKVWVGNLCPTADWKALQAHFNQAGKTAWVEVFDGKGKGTGAIAYKTVEEANNAIAMLNGTQLGNTVIQVDVWVKRAD